MSDTELTILVMFFTFSIMGLGLWIGRDTLLNEEGTASKVKTSYETEISRRKIAATVGQIMLGLVFLALTKPAVRREIEKLFTGQVNFTSEVITILAVEVLWVIVGISLIIYSKKKVLA